MYLYNLFCISKAASEDIFPGQIIQPLSTKRRGCFRVNNEKNESACLNFNFDKVTVSDLIKMLIFLGKYQIVKSWMVILIPLIL